MTIFTDAIGNKFLGDCIWANHNISYPTIKYLQAHPHSSIAQGLADLYTASGKSFTGVANQASFDSYSSCNLGQWKNSDDSSATQYRFRSDIGAGWDASQGGNILFNGGVIYRYDDAGTTRLTQLMILPGGSYRGLAMFDVNIPATSSGVSWVGVADSKSVGLLAYQVNLSNPIPKGAFFYHGELADVNPTLDYYNATYQTRSISLMFNISSLESWNLHFINNGFKQLLEQENSPARYPIVCADAQSPTSQWATDMYVFDNNATLGYPAIGRVRNLLLAQGSYTIGKPVKIQGSAMPDAGFNRWLPVGTFAGKTVLMRCYSSVDI